MLKTNLGFSKSMLRKTQSVASDRVKQDFCFLVNVYDII